MSTAPNAPRPNRRFWTVVAAFAIANVAAWLAWDRYVMAARRGTLRVVTFDPGDNGVVDPRAAVRWRFSTDVVPTDVAGRPPGHATPTVAGRWAWESARTLAFVPATALPRATPVAFTLDADALRTATGASLPTPYVTHVRPAPLEVRAVHQSATLDDTFVLDLDFSDRVVPADVLAHLSVTGPDGHAVACHLFGQAAGDKVRVQTGAVVGADAADAALNVRLSPGLVGADGPLGLDEPFRADVPLARRLTATELTAHAPTRGKPRLSLSFTGPVDPADLKAVLSLAPPVPYVLTADGDSVELTGDFHPGTRYAVTLADAPKSATVADRRRYPRPGTLSAFVPDAGRDCWLDADQGYLSTAGGRTLTAHVVNVDKLSVTVTRVYDDNLVAWRNNPGRRYYRTADTDAYARPAAERTVDCPGAKNDRRDVVLRLDDLLPAALARSGVWRVAVAPATGSADGDDRYYGNDQTSAVVTLSDLGLTAKRTRDGLVAWATSLRAARPVAGVRVRAYSDKNQLLGTATTDDDGLATIGAVHPATGETVAVLLADVPGQTTASAELTWLDLRRGAWDLGDADTAGAAYLRTGHTAFVYADRGVYRPGETVHLRAVVRGPGDVAPKASFPVRWRFRRPDGHDWRVVPALLDADGAAAADVPLPTDLPTGQWSADVALAGDDAKPFGSATFGVEEFVPNRLKVAVSLGSSQRVTVGGDLAADVQADYLFGRPAAGLAVTLTPRATPVPFAPQGWAGWTFGDDADVRPTPPSRPSRHADRPATVADALDGAGHYRHPIDLADALHVADDVATAGGYNGPWRLTADAAVVETGGRALTVSRQIDVDAVPAYVAVRSVNDETPTPGEPRPFRLRLVRPDGSAADDRAADLDLRLLRVSWNTVTAYRDGRYTYDSTRVLSPVATTKVHTDGEELTWAPVPPTAGQYVLEATDAAGGGFTTTAFYATGDGGWDDTVDRSHPDRLQVRVLGPGESDAPTADARARPAGPPTRVGGTARVLIAAPFAGKLLLTVETDAVVQTRVVDMPTSQVIVPIDVTDACRPGAFVTATVLRPVIADQAIGKPHRAFGVCRLNVDQSDRKLSVAIDTPVELRPMTSLDVGLAVTDSAHHAVTGAAVTVAAVDEGICSLTNFATPDPFAFLTARRALGVQSADLFGLLLPESARADVGGDGPGNGDDGDAGSSGRHQSPIGGRRVRPVALAWAVVHTDAAGRARAAFPVPPFQGRLRVMAVAYTADKVGSADRGVTVRSPLLAQTSWPRFAAPGDRFSVPVVLFNNRPTGGTARVTVAPVEDDGLLTLSDADATVRLAAGGQQRVDVNVAVGQRVGVARVRLTAEMGGERYDEEVELPVRPAAPTSQFAGVVRGTVGDALALPGLVPVLPGTGSVRVDVTPWPTLNLPRGLDYLDRYPYGCAEQTTSTMFPLVALGEIGRRLDPAHFDPARVRDKVEVGVTRLIGMQTADGGLSMWPGGTEPWPWASVYAAHCLTVARADGYAVPDDFYHRLLTYVRHELDRGTDAAGGLEVQAYATYVLAMAGRPERPMMSRLSELAAATNRAGEPAESHAQRGDAQLFLSAAWLMAGRRDLAEDMLPAGVPTPRTTREHDGNLGSPVRDRAVLILTLEQVQPDRADLPDLVQQLADAGRLDRWASTQDVAYATLAIGQYLKAEADHHPVGYDAATLLAGAESLASSTGGDPLSWTGEPSAPLSVRLTGPAAAAGHVSWIQTGVPLSPPPAASHGLTVHRQYLSIDGRPIRGVVHSGELVRVQLDLDGPADLANVVMEDLLPAGLEAENARLATAAHDAEAPSDAVPAFGGRTDVRDDRVVIVGRIGSGGRGRATYLARAVTPGVYVAPPARAEAMYDLNTNGTSAAGTLTVTGTPSNVVAAE